MSFEFEELENNNSHEEWEGKNSSEVLAKADRVEEERRKIEEAIQANANERKIRDLLDNLLKFGWTDDSVIDEEDR